MKTVTGILFLLLLMCNVAIAGITGKVSGRITDKGTDESLIGANVVVVGTSLGGSTDVDGGYFIINIPPGVYELRATLVGYKSTTIKGVRVVADQTTTINVALEVSAVEMGDIIVQAERPMVQRDLTATMASVSSEQIKLMPVRNFVEVLQLQAGVVASGNDIHIRGGRSSEVAYLIDGMSVRDPVLGSLGTTVNNDAISELSLMTGTFSAEYGTAMSGVVNIVTKEGSKAFSVNVEGRTSDFGMKRYSDIHENRVNATVSGPISGEDFTFFVSGERDARGSWLPFGYDNVKSGIAKLSGRVIPELKAVFSARYSQEYRQPYNHSWKYIPSEYIRIREYSRQGMLTVTHSVRPNLFYDLRFSYLNQAYYNGIDKDTSQYISSANWSYLPIGTGIEFWEHADPQEMTDNHTRTYNAKGDMVWAIDRGNEIKAGFDFRKFTLNYFNVYDPKRNAPYITNFQKEPIEAAAYVRDKIEQNALVVDVGLRFDYLNQQAPFRTDPLDPNSVVSAKPRTQWSPRLGVAHPISDRTSMHFSYGKFFLVPDYRKFYEDAQYDISVREPLFGDPNLDAQRTTTYEVGINHQFSPTIAASVVASYKDVIGLIGTRYFSPYVAGRYVGYTVYVNEAYANIKSIEVNVNLRRTKYFAGSLNYTYSVAKGSASSEQEDYPGTTTSTLLYPLDWDKPHLFNLNFNIAFPEGFGPSVFGSTIFENTYWNFVLRASSGFPYTPSGRDVGFVPKNSARMPGTYSLDAEIMKEFKINPVTLTVFVEVLNLTDARNVIAVYTDTGEPDQIALGYHSQEYIRDPSNFGPPRRIRLGMGIRF